MVAKGNEMTKLTAHSVNLEPEFRGGSAKEGRGDWMVSVMFSNVFATKAEAEVFKNHLLDLFPLATDEGNQTRNSARFVNQG